MKSIIYLDMDGVLADFRGWAIENFGEEWKTEIEKPNWGAISNTSNLFAKLKPMADALELYNNCVDIIGDKNRVQILTALPQRMNMESAAKDKIEWAHTHISPDIRVHFGPYAQDKQYHKRHKFDVLIDDIELNIQQWESVGGYGIVHENSKKSTEELNSFIMVITNQEMGQL